MFKIKILSFAMIDKFMPDKLKVLICIIRAYFDIDKVDNILYLNVSFCL